MIFRKHRVLFPLLLAVSAVAVEGQGDPVITAVIPSSSPPGRILVARIVGENLPTAQGRLGEQLKRRTTRFGAMGSAENQEIIPQIQVISVTEDGRSAEVQISVHPRARPGSYTLVFEELGRAEIEFQVQPPVLRAYEYCLSSFDIPPDLGLGIVCSQSLMGWKEVKDIFGRRVANTYLVVEVSVRNLNDQYEYLLHDVRLGWDSVASTTRDKRLVRGVSEKGQALDPRNMLVRGIQSVGTVLGGLALLPGATTGFKDFGNLFQGGVREAVEHFFPDFTIEQLNRLNDSAFGYQTLYIPKKSSLSAVTFMPQQVYLTADERKKFKKASDSLFDYQKKLTVQVSGAHVEEVIVNGPTATSIEPRQAAAGSDTILRIVGANLDLARTLRFTHSQSSVSTPMSLIDQDPARARAELPSDLVEGSYNLFLVAADGTQHPTSLSFTVGPAGPVTPTLSTVRIEGGRAVRGQTVRVILIGENLGAIETVEGVFLDDQGSPQVDQGLRFLLRDAENGVRAIDMTIGPVADDLPEARLNTHFWQINGQRSNLTFEIEAAETPAP